MGPFATSGASSAAIGYKRNPSALILYVLFTPNHVEFLYWHI